MSRLKACPDCGHQVSTKAFACPSCGRSLRRTMGSRAAQAFLGLVALFFGLMILGGLAAVIGVTGH